MTRTGDNGTTQLGKSERIAKDDPAIEALGALDELNSVIGLLLTYPLPDKEMINCFTQVQHHLFDLGGELCPPNTHVITPEHILSLEKILEQWNAALPPLKEFILPGGNRISATCHLARTICRRAERCLVTVNRKTAINSESLRYINRLSDLLFVAARTLAQQTCSPETLWEHERGK